MDALKAEQAQAQKAAAGGGKARHVAHAEGWQAVTTQPDLCKVGNSIVAFDSSATLDNKQTASSNVIARGNRREAADCYRKVVEFMRAHSADFDPALQIHFLERIAKLDPPAAAD